MTGVTIEGVRVEREGRVVLDVPSLTLAAGRTTAILGPNGSGKTTLLRVIAGLERLRAGRVDDGGPPSAKARDVAYVFQEDVFLRESVRWNLEIGLRLRGVEPPGGSSASRPQHRSSASTISSIDEPIACPAVKAGG